MRQRRPWLATLILVVVLGGLAAYVFLVEARREPPPEEGALPTPAPLWEFNGSDVAGVTVTRAGQTTAVELAGEREWHMLKPAEGVADSARLNGFAYAVSMVRFSRAVAGVTDLAPYGLQEPEMQATLVLTNGTTITLNVGTENPRRTARYVQKVGDPLVYLVPTGDLDGLFRLLDEPPYPPTPTPPSTSRRVPSAPVYTSASPPRSGGFRDCQPTLVDVSASPPRSGGFRDRQPTEESA